MSDLPVNLRIILDLCDGSGAASIFYREAGYDVKGIDIKYGQDIRFYEAPVERIYGILASPPCTDLAASGARWWKEKGQQAFLEALALADACMRTILLCDMRYRLKFWILENPVGRLWRIYGKPNYFQPCDFGDDYTKKTGVIGRFVWPFESPAIPVKGSKMHLLPPAENRSDLRSISSKGFAQAFFEANR